MLLSSVFDGQPTNVFVVDYFFSFEISLLWRQRCLFNFDLYVDRPSVAIYVARCVLCRCVFQDDGKTARMLSSHTPGDASITSTTISSSFSIFFTYLFISLSSSLFLSFSLLCFFVFFWYIWFFSVVFIFWFSLLPSWALISTSLLDYMPHAKERHTEFPFGTVSVVIIALIMNEREMQRDTEIKILPLSRLEEFASIFDGVDDDGASWSPSTH